MPVTRIQEIYTFVIDDINYALFLSSLIKSSFSTLVVLIATQMQ